MSMSQMPPALQDLQNFVWAIEYDDRVPIATLDEQAQALDYLFQLLHHCVHFNDIPKGLHLHPEFFATDYVEKLFIDLIADLDESLSAKAEAVFLKGLSFAIEYIGDPESREVVASLMKKLQERFPKFKKMYDDAIANFIEEFFRLDVGHFIKQHADAVDQVEKTYPLLYELFVAPLKITKFANGKLCNFFCNPWIYFPIMRHMAYSTHSDTARERTQRFLGWLEKYLHTIRAHTTEDSWQELTRKAHNTLTQSKNLESFATETAGLIGEIKTAAQFIQDSFCDGDTLLFLSTPKEQGKKGKAGKNCDIMVIRHVSGERELIECKAKTPRHGLDEQAGDAQVWNDFFTNFSPGINQYFAYLQEIVSTPMGFTQLFPLFRAYEGADYGWALPLIGDIFKTQNTLPLKEWSSENKIRHLLQTMFLRPLVLNPACVVLPSDAQRLAQRQTATRDVFQKSWVKNLLEKAISQLKETEQREKAKGCKISKRYVALDLALSYRLTHDPLSHEDGNIQEVAEQALQEAFKPFQEAFTAQDLILELLIIAP